MKTWLKGLLAAIIGGTANAITTVVVAPDTFNFTTGLDKLLSVAGASALISAALYLKKSPLPDDGGVARNGLPLIALALIPGCALALGGCAVATGDDGVKHYTYAGPSVGIQAGYKGVSLGVTLYGENPAIAAASNANATQQVALPSTRGLAK